jgi:aspartate aminotransferase
MAERTILCSGASKSFSWTGGRVGWAAFPTVEEARVLKNLNINYFSCVPPYNQEGAREGLENPKTRLAIAEMVQAFQDRRDVVVAALNAIPGVDCQNPGGAFYVFPNIGGLCERLGVFDAYRNLPDDLRSRTSPSTLFQMFLLYHHHVAAVDRRSFGRIGTEDLHFIRLSIATGMEDLKRGVAGIAAAADDRPGFVRFMSAGRNLF